PLVIDEVRKVAIVREGKRAVVNDGVSEGARSGSGVEGGGFTPCGEGEEQRNGRRPQQRGEQRQTRRSLVDRNHGDCLMVSL
ncbi:MAG: hypothetical protein SGPRY_014421, partial [Prymnesium sp.]